MNQTSPRGFPGEPGYVPEQVATPGTGHVVGNVGGSLGPLPTSPDFATGMISIPVPAPAREPEYADPGEFAQPMPAEITKAIVQVMKSVGSIGKTGQNKFHGYSYASIEDLMPPLQKAMADAGVVITQHPVRVAEDSGGNMVVHFRFMLHHESGASYNYPGHWLGVAGDRDRSGRLGDKWANKAATAAEKYFLLKLFRIPVSDGTPQPLSDGDPDAGPTQGPTPGYPYRGQQAQFTPPVQPATRAQAATQEERELANSIRDAIDASDKPMQVLIDRHDDLTKIRAVSETAAASLEKRAAERTETLKTSNQEKAA